MRPVLAAAATPSEPLELALVHPYAPGKVPVVLVHGLWGSPRQWQWMVQALEADALVRGHFQFLTFGYATSDPIPYSASLLRRALRDFRDRLDPSHSEPAMDRMVLVGHSLGGLLCKMMAQESGTRLWDLATCVPFERVGGPQEARELLRRELVFKPIPEAQRLIFIATPHRGSRLDWEPIRGITTFVVRPSSLLRQAYTSLLASNGTDAFTNRFRAGLPTSVDELKWEHPFLLAIDGLPLNPDAKQHSIIAYFGETARPGGGDGLAPYASAQHPGATSELLVGAGHCCLNNREVIAEVARILKEHASP
jgi:pimeloyl-ACP methyl ester carboxylesterase